MKNILFLLFFLLVGLQVKAQKPAWTDAGFRNSKHPANEFAVGYCENDKNNRKIETQEFIRTCVNAAKAELVNSIQSLVESTAESNTIEGNMKFSQTFVGKDRVSSKLEINQIEVEQYYDPKTEQVFAFAHVRKEDVVRYYSSQVEKSLGEAQQNIATAQKPENKKMARVYFKNAAASIFDASKAQQVLIALTDDPTKLQLSRTNTLKATVEEAINSLKYNLIVSVSGTETNFDVASETVIPSIKTMLAKNNFMYIDTPESADYIINVSGKTRKHPAPPKKNIYFAYADVTVSIIDNMQKKNFPSYKISEKGGGVDYESAGEDAYRNVIEKMLPLLLETLKQ